VLAFSDTAQAELLRLDDGDALSVQGALRVEAYSKDGEPRVGLTVIADAAIMDWPKPLSVQGRLLS